MMSDDDTMSISDPVDMHRNCLDLGNRPTLRKSSIIIPHFNSWHMYHTHTGLPSFPYYRMIMIAAHMPWSIACLTWPSTVPWTTWKEKLETRGWGAPLRNHLVLSSQTSRGHYGRGWWNHRRSWWIIGIMVQVIVRF